MPMVAGLPTEARFSRPPVGRSRSFTMQTSILTFAQVVNVGRPTGARPRASPRWTHRRTTSASINNMQIPMKPLPWQHVPGYEVGPFVSSLYQEGPSSIKFRRSIRSSPSETTISASWDMASRSVAWAVRIWRCDSLLQLRLLWADG